MHPTQSREPGFQALCRGAAVGIGLALLPLPVHASAPVLCPDRIVLKPRTGTTRALLRSRLQTMGFKVRNHAAATAGDTASSATSTSAGQESESALLTIPVTPGDRMRVLNQLAARTDVGFAAPVYLYPVAAVPNDPSYTSQYHHAVMGSPAAWDVTRGSSSVKIAILDTGVDATHPDLVGKVLPGYNAWSGTTDTRDDHGHGTAVAGCAAAATNNGKGVAGMSWSSPILPVRIVDTANTAPSDTIAAGMRWAVDHGARILNISFSPLQSDIVVSDAAAYVRSRGGLVFCAMGNDAQRKTATEDPNIIFVTATTATDLAATFTSFGPTAKLSAPGQDVYTTLKGGGFGPQSGTSFASPLAAGAAALVWTANPSLTPAQVEECLFSTARDLGATGRDDLFGYGRVDAAAAVRRAIAPAAPTSVKAALTSPVAGSALSSTSVTFLWNAGTGVSRTWLYVGTAANPTAFFNQDMGTVRSATVSGLPADGSSVQVTLWSQIGSVWQSTVTTHKAFTTIATAMLTSPAPGSTLTGSRVTFTWSAAPGATAYWIYVGSSAGASNYGSASTGTARTYTATSLPMGGTVVYVRLWYLVAGTWRSVDALYRAAMLTALR